MIRGKIKRRFAAFFVACLFVLCAHAQNTDCLTDILAEFDIAEPVVSETNRDTTDVLNYWQKWRGVIYSNPDSAKAYALAALRLSIDINYDFGKGGSVLRLANAHQYASKYADAERLMQCAIALEFQYGSPRTQSIALSDLGVVLYNQRKPSEAHEQLDKSVDLARTHNLGRYEAQALQNKARVYNQQGYHKLAADCNFKALRIFEAADNKEMIGSCFNTIGVTYVYAKEYEKAIENFRRTANIAAGMGASEDRFQAEAIGNMGYCFQELNQFDSAYHAYNSAHALAENSGDKIGVMIYLIGKGNALSHLGRHERAIKSLEDGLQMANTLNSAAYKTTSTFDLIEAFVRANKTSQAKMLLTQIPKPSKTANARVYDKWLQANYALAEKQNESKKAFTFYKKITATKDSMSAIAKTAELEELNIIYDLEKKEDEIKLLEERTEKDQWRLGALGLGLLSTIFLALLLFRWQQRRARLRRERVQKRLGEIELEKSRLSESVQAKDREIAAQSVLSAKQQDDLQLLKKSLSQLRDQDNVPSHEVQRLIRQVDQQLGQGQGWQHVLETFSEVHPGFIEKLKQEYPSLTSSDLRLAALMRMNLDSKSIAELLHISPDSVKRARNRFRQKIDIETDIRLQDWILQRSSH